MIKTYAARIITDVQTLKILITIVALTTTIASAQPHGDLQPVDQAVADLDLLATSLRHIQTGLRTDGEQTSLFVLKPSPTNAFDTPGQTPPPWGINEQPVYYRIGPGFQAKVDRMDYLIRTGKRQFEINIKPLRDGEFFEMIPANTVFDLTPRTTTPTIDRPQSTATDRRIDARLDLRVDTRVDGNVNSLPPFNPTTP